MPACRLTDLPPPHETDPLIRNSEYTTELINLLHVLTLLVDLEPKQAVLLERILAGELISESELTDAGALAAATPPLEKKNQSDSTSDLFGQVDKPPIAHRTL